MKHRRNIGFQLCCKVFDSYSLEVLRGWSVRKGLRQAVRVLPTEAGSKVALRVSIHEKYLFALHSQSNAEVYCRGGFPHAAFLIADSNGFTVWHFAFSSFLLDLDRLTHQNTGSGVLCFGGRI